jgi:hypothetical protein
MSVIASVLARGVESAHTLGHITTCAEHSGERLAFVGVSAQLIRVHGCRGGTCAGAERKAHFCGAFQLLFLCEGEDRAPPTFFSSTSIFFSVTQKTPIFF